MRNLFRLLFLSAATTMPATVHAEWREASTPHFVIYSQQSQKALRASAEKLERLDQALRLTNRWPDPQLSPANRLTVVLPVHADHIFEDNDYYRGRAGASLVIATSPNIDSYNVLFREYARHLSSTIHAVPLPPWLAEGYARLYDTAFVDNSSKVYLGEILFRQYLDDSSRMPVADLVQLRVRLPEHQRFSMSATSWLLTHYLTFEPARQGQLQKYVEGFAAERTSLDAAHAAFGDLDQLDRELAAYAERSTLTEVQVQPATLKVQPIQLRELSSTAQAMLPLRLVLKSAVEGSKAEKLLRQVRKAAERYPDDAYAQVVLAETELAAGYPATAEAAADRALAANPQSLDAHVYKGRAQMVAQRKLGTRDPQVWSSVRQWFLKANRLDPEDPEPLILFYLSFLAAGETPTANSVMGLQRAFELAPQDDELALLVACQSLREGNPARALKPLASISYDPQTDELRDLANYLLRQLDQSRTAKALETCMQEDLKW